MTDEKEEKDQKHSLDNQQTRDLVEQDPHEPRDPHEIQQEKRRIEQVWNEKLTAQINGILKNALQLFHQFQSQRDLTKYGPPAWSNLITKDMQTRFNLDMTEENRHSVEKILEYFTKHTTHVDLHELMRDYDTISTKSTNKQHKRKRSNVQPKEKKEKKAKNKSQYFEGKKLLPEELEDDPESLQDTKDEDDDELKGQVNDDNYKDDKDATEDDKNFIASEDDSDYSAESDESDKSDDDDGKENGGNKAKNDNDKDSTPQPKKKKMKRSTEDDED